MLKNLCSALEGFEGSFGELSRAPDPRSANARGAGVCALREGAVGEAAEEPAARKSFSKDQCALRRIA